MYRAVSRRAPSIDFSSRGYARKRGRETKTFFAIENEATIRVYPWNEEEEGGGRFHRQDFDLRRS